MDRLSKTNHDLLPVGSDLNWQGARILSKPPNSSIRGAIELFPGSDFLLQRLELLTHQAQCIAPQ